MKLSPVIFFFFRFSVCSPWLPSGSARTSMVSDGNTILFVIILYAWHLQACSKKGILSIERGLSQSGQTQAHTTVQHCK